MRLHALQYLRALAALAVVYSHAVLQVDAYAPHLVEFGGFGVDVFFVISGFIMVWIAKPGDTPRRFLANRIRRVVPLYWFFTLLMALILVLLPELFKRSTFAWDTFLLSLAFVPHESAAHPGWLWPIVAPGWSLNYEMYFYLLFALSLVLPAAWRVGGAIALLTGVTLVSRAFGEHSEIARFYGEGMVFEFVLGMLLAVAWQRGLRLPSWLAALMLVLGTALLLAHLPLPRLLAFGFPSLLVVAGAVYIALPVRRWGVLLGDASYALYLSHLFTLGVLRVSLPPLLGEGAVAAWAFVAISLVVCTLVSVIVHVGIDGWLLRVERLAWLRRPGRPGTGGSVVPREREA